MLWSHNQVAIRYESGECLRYLVGHQSVVTTHRIQAARFLTWNSIFAAYFRCLYSSCPVSAEFYPAWHRKHFVTMLQGYVTRGQWWLCHQSNLSHPLNIPYIGANNNFESLLYAHQREALAFCISFSLNAPLYIAQYVVKFTSRKY